MPTFIHWLSSPVATLRVLTHSGRSLCCTGFFFLLFTWTQSIINMSKRARTQMTGARSSRPIDKSLISIEEAVNGSQTAVTLSTTTFPCTIVGLRWALSSNYTNTTGGGRIHWAIVLVPDGQSASTMATSSGADFYTPEQNVLAFGMGRFPDADANAGNVVGNWEGSTKTMRKMKAGDLLQFIVIGSATNIAKTGYLR